MAMKGSNAKGNKSDPIEGLIYGIYNQCALDIEDMLIGRKIKGETIYSILDYIATGPRDIVPEQFLELCIEKRMQLSKMKTMPKEWQKYINYARDL